MAAQVAEMEVESGESDQEGEGDDEGTGKGQSMDEESSAADSSTPQEPQKQQINRAKRPHEITQQPIPAAPKPDSVIVRKDYNPKTKQVLINFFFELLLG